MRQQRSIMMIAGEASGDQRGAEVVRAIKQKTAPIRFFGIGGNDMRAAGVDTLIDINELAVMGFIEVIKHLPHLLAVMRRTKEILLREKPDLLILVDYPGFNLRIAKFAKQHKIRVLFYISPQVWAWRQGRVKKIAQVVDHMAVIFPFEKKFYEDHHVPVTYVGHPLTETIKQAPSKSEAMTKLGLVDPVDLKNKKNIITLCPGSRNAELQALLPPMLAAATLIAQCLPNSVFLIAQASTINRQHIIALIESNLIAPIATESFNLNIKIVPNDPLSAMSAADVIITASGTATLEAALLNKPMVIVYKVSKVTAFIVKRMLKIPFISLCNIVAGEKVVAELLQDDVTAINISREVLAILEDDTVRNAIIKKLRSVNEKLGDLKAAEHVADIVMGMMK